MTREECWILEEKYGGEKTEGFFTDCERLKNGEPLAYIIGSIPFLNTEIFLDSHPLIPRTETEFWVHEILKIMKETFADRLFDVLDLCAGSGCIGVAVLKAFPMVRVDFSEIDAHHHTTIQKNITENGIGIDRTHIFAGDLFSEIPKKQYDYILTNPPYIDQTLGRTETSVHTHEPHLALYSDERGLSHILRVLEKAKGYLAPHGILVLEHEPEQSFNIQHLSAQFGFNAETRVDQFGIERFTICSQKNQ